MNIFTKITASLGLLALMSSTIHFAHADTWDDLERAGREEIHAAKTRAAELAKRRRPTVNIPEVKPLDLTHPEADQRMTQVERGHRDLGSTNHGEHCPTPGLNQFEEVSLLSARSSPVIDKLEEKTKWRSLNSNENTMQDLDDARNLKPLVGASNTLTIKRVDNSQVTDPTTAPSLLAEDQAPPVYKAPMIGGTGKSHKVIGLQFTHSFGGSSP